MREWGEEFVKRHGFWAIVLGRFLVALRGPVYLAIGAAKVPFGRFELVNTIVALIEGAALVWLGYAFGQSQKISHEVRWVEIAIGVVILVAVGLPLLLKWRLAKRRSAAA